MSGGINIESITQSIGKGAGSAIDDVNAAAKSLDPSNPQDMIKMQMKMMKMNTLVQFESQMVKSIEDMVKGILQRMN